MDHIPDRYSRLVVLAGITVPSITVDASFAALPRVPKVMTPSAPGMLLVPAVHASTLQNRVFSVVTTQRCFRSHRIEFESAFYRK